MGKRINEAAAREIFRLAGLKPLEPFAGARQKWKSKCFRCGGIVTPYFYSVNTGSGCEICARAKAAQRQQEKGLKRAIEVFLQSGFELIGSYKNAKSRVLVRCLACGSESRTTQSAVKSASFKCNCKKGPRRPLAETFPEFAAEFHPKKNGNLSLDKIGTGYRLKVWWLCSMRHEFQMSPASRVASKSPCPVCAEKVLEAGKNDLRALHPELFAQLLNRKALLNTAIHPHSNKKFDWKCSKNPSHVWRASVDGRVRGYGCPFCAGKVVIPGENDLQSRYPGVAKEWHEKNLLKPSQVISGSNKKFWWRCKIDNSHQWEAAVSSRVKGSGCPICANQKLLVGFNDMATLHPELKAIWHPTKNGDLQPFELIGGSSKKVWWQCERNPRHAWQSPPNRLVTQGRGCPVCSNKILVSGQNDLETMSPELAKEFDRELNQGGPETVNVGSHRKYWWRCNVRPTHLWQASPGQRKQGQGCPYCAGRLVEPGFNDFESRYPDLAREWDLDLNNGLLPSQVTKSSQMKAAWKCARDRQHQWVATVASRASGNGCPVCSGQKTVAGINDLETKYDWIASQWHPVKNGNIKPNAVSPGSTKKAWWTCTEHPTHEWLASVASRTRMNSGCPICANLQVQAGFNDLETVGPDVAKTWHKAQNGPLTPSQVVSGTNRLVWWQCPSVESHAWRTSVKNRLKGKGCPQCLPAGYQTSKPGYFYAIKNLQLGAKKIGITNNPSTEGRLRNFSALGWDIVKVWYFEDGFIPLAAETRLLRWIRQDLNLPPYLGPTEMKRAGGWSETFSNDGLDDEVLLSECSRVLMEESNRVEKASKI